jgi:Ca2+-transporting ATPase
MVFLGFVGMIDPPRYEVRDAIKICEHAGIKPIMITGDHKITAVAIARELGILKEGNAISGIELETLSIEEFDEVAVKTEVYARISPEHKLKIVDALMRKGNIVAMTGDGVNDAPALKKADIGIAMGITGTDVSKEAADMILTDDNFASIVAAVEEGRSIFENIRKYLVFLLSGNIGKVLAMLVCLLAALPIPLTAVQILFMNFIMDGLMAIALGVEPPEPAIMDKKPRNVKEGVLNNFSIIFIGSVGTMIGLVSVGVFYLALKFGYSEMDAMTIFFYTLIFSRLFNAYNCRSLVQPVYKLNFFSNKALIYSALGTILMIIAISEISFFREVFHISFIGFKEAVYILLASVTIFVSVEIAKIIKIKTLLAK